MQALDVSKAGSGINLKIYDSNVYLGTVKIGHGSIQ
jgi:hypothetical protein